jgi:ABC-2 type transport system ATP-binding protein
MLKISHIVKKYENVTALQNVSLSIMQGEFFGLLGPNGAGKSTLMNIIIGYVEADSGNITIDDKIMSFENIELRKKIGFVPQEISLYLELTAYQNLKIFGQFYGMSSKVLGKKIDKVVELVQLKERIKDPVKEFSGGMKRRLNLAASLLHEPEIILCDEPTVGVDPQSRNAIFDMLSFLNKSGKTIVYTTHYMEEAERLCSRLAVIDNGNIITHGSLTELIGQMNIKDTIKIQKTPFTTVKLSVLNKIGRIIENDFDYELVPKEGLNKMSMIFSELESIGIPDTAIQISRATLEDVFLNLTGRRLRD